MRQVWEEPLRAALTDYIIYMIGLACPARGGADRVWQTCQKCLLSPRHAFLRRVITGLPGIQEEYSKMEGHLPSVAAFYPQGLAKK